MEQRVNIQYSIELKDLEGEVQRLFQRVATDIKDINGQLSLSPIEELDLESVEKLSLLRTQLQSAATTLHDIEQIILGFVSYKLQASRPTAQEEESQTDEITPASEGVSVLQQQLEEYRLAIQNLTPSEMSESDFVNREQQLQEKLDDFADNVHRS
jgi:hypothetical protein